MMANASEQTLIDELLENQRNLTAVERFSKHHDLGEARQRHYSALMPASAPAAGQQYAFDVEVDQCSGCKACVTACHSLNGLGAGEAWREVGTLVSNDWRRPLQKTITSACHHCVDPACLNGCPVLAYEKDPSTGIVRHLDDQCIGCQYCVMMCPYEAPKYSESLGIVRKCDMCSQRLAMNEAPACVQACPNEAIRITVVNTEMVRENLSSHTPPAFPDPAITLPATRYVFPGTIPDSLVPRDSEGGPLQPTHASLVWMLTMTQIGVGLFLAGAFSKPRLVMPFAAAGTILAVIGLVAGVLHLGHPLKSWRAFLGLRKSWLSREIIAFGIFAPLGALTTLVDYSGSSLSPCLIGLTSSIGLGAVGCSAMIYHSTKRPFWSGRGSFVKFFGTTILTASLSHALLDLGNSSLLACVTFLLAVAVRISIEQEQSRSSEDPDRWAEFKTAELLRGRLGLLFRTRLVLLTSAVAIALTLMSGLLISKLLVVAALALFFTGELLERVLFFKAVVPLKRYP